ncbi:MAG: OmpA family protein, partial [Planctomycetota bacterium]
SVGRRRPGDPATPTQSRRSEAKECVMVKRAMSGVVGGAVVLMALGGCVNQQQYDQLQDAYDAQRDQNTNLARENEMLQDTIDLMRGSNTQTEGAIGDLQQQNNDLRAQLARSNEMLASIDTEIRTLRLVDAEFDQALRDLAARYANVIVYDPDLGMLRFRSDLTFNSGSDQVRDNARDALSALADVIKNNANASYTLQIVGHTDSEPISSGTAQRHPTNTHLSVHRAIAVKQSLTSLGVPAERVMVAGWGEFRPAVPNGPGGNTPQNRRVEIFFQPDEGSFETADVVPGGNDPAGSFTDPTK